MNFKKQIFNMARQDLKTLVFPEASFSDIIIQSIRLLAKKKLAKIIIIGDESALYLRYSSLENEFLKIINPKTSELKEIFFEQLIKLDKFKKMDEKEIENLVENPYYFSALLVKNAYADAIISGTESSSAQTFSPALEIINTKQNSEVSACTLMIGKNKFIHNRPLLIANTAIKETLSAEELVLSAYNCVEFWKTIFITEPKVAFLSASTNGSLDGEMAKKMRKATEIFKYKYPSIIADGEMQLDCALNNIAQKKKFDNCRIKGDANILIPPDLTSANILCKSFRTISKLKQIGPISLGLEKPVCDVSRVSSLEEIVLLCVIAGIQAQT